MLIGRYIAASVAKRILLKIAASEGFKRLSIRLGFGTAASGTGVGAVVTLLMFQGVAQRASDGRKELENAIPALSRLLKQNGNLDLLYFLIKDPMQKHLQGIQKGQKFPKFFEEAALQVHVHAEGY